MTLEEYPSIEIQPRRPSSFRAALEYIVLEPKKATKTQVSKTSVSSQKTHVRSVSLGCIPEESSFRTLSQLPAKPSRSHVRRRMSIDSGAHSRKSINGSINRYTISGAKPSSGRRGSLTGTITKSLSKAAKFLGGSGGRLRHSIAGAQEPADLLDLLLKQDWLAVSEILETSKGSKVLCLLVETFTFEPYRNVSKEENKAKRRHSSIENVIDRTILSSALIDVRYTPNLLHLMCKRQAPIQLLERIISIRPEYLLEKNELQQNVLHLAAEWGESHFVLEWFMTSVPYLCAKADSFGRYPLHAYCASGRLPRSGTNFKTLNQRAQLVGVLTRMCNACPEAIHTKDEGGLTPFMHAERCQVKRSLKRVLLKSQQKHIERVEIFGQ